MRNVLQRTQGKEGNMIIQESVTLVCEYCNAEIERHTNLEAREALAEHQNYVQCIKGY